MSFIEALRRYDERNLEHRLDSPRGRRITDRMMADADALQVVPEDREPAGDVARPPYSIPMRDYDAEILAEVEREAFDRENVQDPFDGGRLS